MSKELPATNIDSLYQTIEQIIEEARNKVYRTANSIRSSKIGTRCVPN